MAGKEKKLKLSDSPSLNASAGLAINKTGVANATATNAGGTTPKGTKTRGRRSLAAVPLDETSNASTELESVQSMEDVEENSNQTPDSPTSKTRKASKNNTAVNEDVTNEENAINETSAENTESPRTSKRGAKKGTKAKVVKKLGLNKKAIVISKRKTPLGVTNRKVRGKTVRRKRRHSAGEGDLEKTEEDASSELTKTLRNGKPRADSPSGMKKRARLPSDTHNSMPEPIVKPELIKTEAPASDSEVVIAGRGRRRSDSLSKCSDTTDTSSLQDQILLQKSPSKLSQASSVENNNDGAEQDAKVPDKLKILDKMSQSFNHDALPSEVIAAVDTAKFVRRSTRQRRSAVTPTPMLSPALLQVKTEPKEEEILVNPMEIPVDEASLPAILPTSSPPSVLEKADSVSPEPDVVDQNNRALHVKQFYGQPVFMENNVGIESDPNLGEIITQAPLLEKQPTVVPANEISQPKEDEKQTADDPMDSIPLSEINVMTLVETKTKEVEDNKGGVQDVEMPLVVPPVEAEQIKSQVVHAPEVPQLIDNGHEESDVDIDVERLDDVAVGDLTFEEERPLSERIAQSRQNSTSEPPPSIAQAMEEVQAGVKEMLDKMSNDDEPPVLTPEQKTSVDKVVVPMEEEETKENVEPMTIEIIKEMKKSETPPPLLELESPESLMHKESVMSALGLLTLQAADAAKLERKKQKEQRLLLQQSGGRGAGYTGTLKTVIKLNRGTGSASGDKRKARGPLKMTFQKGRGKLTAAQREALKAESDGTTLDATGQGGDGMYYTIQNEMVSGRARQWDTSSGGPELHGGDNMAATSAGYTGTNNHTSSANRKSYSRHSSYNTGDGSGSQYPLSHHNHNASLSSGGGHLAAGAGGAVAPLAPSEAAKALVIPEKASSFSIHPGRLCRDQCHYCGGKFGLFDTPCHVAQIKSQERQKRILDMEEKLTVDNCLCDACYRHVDRRANCPSYRKRTSAASGVGQQVVAPSGESENSEVGQPAVEAPKPICRVVGCTEEANNTLRRKWLVKMKKSVSKILQLEPDVPHAPGSHSVPLCRTHYDAVSHLLVCALCKRRLARNHANYLGAAEAARAAGLLGAQGVPAAELGGPNAAAAAVCKLCRYYVGLLLKAEAEGGRTPKATFIKSYRRRLLESHNIEVLDESESEDQLLHQFVPGVPGATTKKPKPTKANVKKSNRKSTESPTDQQSDAYEFHTALPTDNKDDLDDIENIISKNTIQVTRNLDPSPNCNNNSQHKLNENGLQKAGPSLLLANLSNSAHKKNRLDEILSQQQTAEQLKAEKVQQLRSNPSLSVRELFPGEEEMGLHASIPLSRGGPRTPEGWTRCTTTIQYDEETRRLWNKLQEPYGNQSSFLRHLILLEKYFRSGDLILSQNATSSATNYSESVQNRLRSFDYIPSNNNLEITTAFRPNLTVTKTPSSAISQVINPLAHIPSMSLTSASSEISQLAKRLKGDKKSPANVKQNESDSASIRQNSAFVKPNRKPEETKQKRSPSVPPDLISIGSKSSTSAAPIAALKRASLPSTTIESPVTAALKIPALTATSSNNTTKVSLTDTAPAFVSASLAIQAAAAVTSVPSATTISTSVFAATSGSSLTVVPVSNSTPVPSLNTTTNAPEAATVPTEPVKKNPSGSKPWRPTLIPIDPNSEPPNTGQLFQTVDGRRLPSLVQVMSGGKPYHISIQDYNRMCILRRQKVVQMQKNQLLQKLKDAQKPDCKIAVEIKNTFTSGNKKKVDIPNKVLEQNSVIPIRGSDTNKGKKAVNASSLLKNLPQLNKNLTVARTSVSASTNSSLSNSGQKSDNSISITTEDGYWAWDAVKKQRNSTEESNKSQMETMLSKIPKSLTVIPQKAINRTNSTSPLSVQPLMPSNLLKNQDENNP